jgi:hypothetical protein
MPEKVGCPPVVVGKSPRPSNHDQPWHPNRSASLLGFIPPLSTLPSNHPCCKYAGCLVHIPGMHAVTRALYTQQPSSVILSPICTALRGYPGVWSCRPISSTQKKKPRNVLKDSSRHKTLSSPQSVHTNVRSPIYASIYIAYQYGVPKPRVHSRGHLTYAPGLDNQVIC